MAQRRIDVFFYGPVMDRQLLESKGVEPLDIRLAAVSEYASTLRSLAQRLGLPSAYIASIR